MRRVALAIFATIASLVGLLSFKTHSTSIAAAPAVVSTAPPAAGTDPTSTEPSSSARTSGSASTAATTKTVTGESIDTRWGPVQVKITVTNGKVTGATAVDYRQKQRARPGDQLLRRPDSGERNHRPDHVEDRHGVRRDIHQRRLHSVAAKRSGQAVTGPAADSRAVHVEHCMGTVFTIDIRDSGRWDDAIGDAVAWLHHVDVVFSTNRPESQISRMSRGELPIGNASVDVHDVLGLCADLQLETGGYFTAVPNGVVDPTGLVKGWAIERASGMLRAHGSANHAVNGGGDMQLAVESAPGRPWRVGIVDPRERNQVTAVVEGRDLAVATSGMAECGRTSWTPSPAGRALRWQAPPSSAHR